MQYENTQKIPVVKGGVLKKIGKVCNGLLWLACIAFILFGAFFLYRAMESDDSLGLSDSISPVFDTDATLDETFDAFFDEGEWSNKTTDGVTLVRYQGICRRTEDDSDVEASIYFEIDKEEGTLNYRGYYEGVTG